MKKFFSKRRKLGVASFFYKDFTPTELVFSLSLFYYKDAVPTELLQLGIMNSELGILTD